MNDRYSEVLSQYELEVSEVRRGRGAWLCETNRGLMLLREYKGTVKRLEFEDSVFARIGELGTIPVDRYVRNREGGILSTSDDGSRWILKEWYSDRECSLKDSHEVLSAIHVIACLHRVFRQIEFQNEWNLGSILTRLPDEEMARHNRELVRTRSFIRGKRKKSDFELCVMGNYDMFFEEARAAEDGMKRFILESSLENRFLCHGDLNQHHILMRSRDTAVVEFNRMHLGMQMEDLYHFVRKAMEKHDWNLKLGMSMLETYDRVLPMTPEDRACLYYLFLYPEKYWKQMNFYYNANKAWIPARNIEKLRDLEVQQPMRRLFLSQIRKGL